MALSHYNFFVNARQRMKNLSRSLAYVYNLSLAYHNVHQRIPTHAQRMHSLSLAFLANGEIMHNVRLTYAELTCSVLGAKFKIT